METTIVSMDRDERTTDESKYDALCNIMGILMPTAKLTR